MTAQTLLTTAGGLALALALVLIAARLARALGFASTGGSIAGGAGRQRRMTLSETIPIDARRRLHLVRCDGRDILVLTGGGQDVMLPLDAQPEVPGR